MSADSVGVRAAPEPLRAWLILTAIAVVFMLNSGFAYYGASVLNAFMARELDISRGMLGAGFTLMLLVQGLSGPLIAGAMRRFGLRVTVTAGSLGVAAGALAMATVVQGPWSYLAAFGVVVGLGTGFSTYIPSQTLVAQWFERRRTLAFSLVIAAGSIGGFVIAPLFGQLLGDDGEAWRRGWWLAAACVFGMALLAWSVIRDRQAGAAATGTTPASGGQAAGDAEAWPLRRLMRMPVLWVMVLGDLAVGMPIMSVLAHGIAHLGEIGATPAQGAAAIGLTALSGLTGKLLGGLLGDRIAPQRFWALSCLVVALGLVLLVDATGPWRLYGFAVVLGTGYGAGLVCKSSFIGARFGPAAFGKVMGAMAPISICLTALSPYWVGLSWAWRESYAPAFIAQATLALLAAVALFALRQRGRH